MPKSDPSSEDFVGTSPTVGGRDFERLVALSCWFILVFEDERDALTDDDLIELIVDHEENARMGVYDFEPWQMWRALGEVESDAEFADKLNSEILSDLQLRYQGSSSALALLPQAFEGLPVSILRTMLRAALEFDSASSVGGEELPLDEMRNLWDFWKEKAELSETRYGMLFSSTLSEFLVNALCPGKDESVYDPCARDGAVLAECAERKVRHLFAVEENPRLAVVAAARSRLHSEQCPIVRCGSPLDLPPLEDGYDCVIGNFPWGGKVTKTEQTPELRVPTNSQELLNLQHGLAALKPGGRAAFVLSAGFLFRSGSAEEVRRMLLRDYCVDAVIELPANSTAPTTAAKGAVLLIRRAPPRDDVWFITSEQFSNSVDHRSYTNDDLDHEILMVAMHARMGIHTPTELRAEIDRLTQKAESPAFTKDCDPQDAEWLTENGRELLSLARRFIEPNPEPAATGKFRTLIPIPALSRRNWELLWKPSAEQSLDALLTDLVAARKDVSIRTLGDVAQVIGGAYYSSREFLEPVATRRRAPGDAIGLVRVSDFPRFTPGEPEVRTLRAVNRHIELLPSKNENRLLRPNDVLVSIGGTIGRVCLFQVELTHPSLAANGLAIIRTTDRATSSFLAKLFTSEPYQQWFSGESTGSVIRHLTLTRLRELPVPVLPRSDMLSITNELETGASEIRVRAVFTSKKDLSALAARLADGKHVSAFANLSAEELERGTTIDLLRAACDELSGWERATAREEDVVRKRLDVFRRLATTLLEALGLPESGDRFTVLQEWRATAVEKEREFRRIRNELVHATGGSEKHRLVEMIFAQRTEGFISNLLRLAQSVMQRQLGGARLSATIAPAVVTIGKPIELIVTVRNEGTLALQGVTLELPEHGGGASRPCPILPGQGTQPWPFVWVPEETGKKLFQIPWRASRIDGTATSAVFELAVEVQSLRADAKSRRLEVSPYITGTSLSARDRDLFFGRNDVLEEIRRSLRPAGPGTVLILDGVRRVGKTSVLKQLLAPDALPGWLPVYYCLQGASGEETAHGVPTREMFYEIAKELILAAHGSACTVDVPEFRSVSPTDTTKQLRLDMRTTLRSKFNADPAPFELFEMIVTSVVDSLDGRRLLLMLDEFDKVQIGIESGVTNRNVPENFRELIHRHERVSAILTGSQLMKTLRREYFHPLFGIGKSIPIGALDRKSAQLLVTRPVEGTLTFSDSARDAIVDVCACQPFLIQHLCSAVFDIAALSGQESITTEHVEQAISIWLERDQHFAIVLKSDVDDPRRQCVLFVIAELDRRGISVTFEVLREELEERGLAGDAALTDHLQYLADAIVVSCEGTDDLKVYRIAIPLLARWLARQDAALYLARAQRFDEGRL